MTDTNTQADQQGAQAAPEESRGASITKIASIVVWSSVAALAAILAVKVLAPNALSFGGPEIGVVNIQGLIEEYQHDALDTARKGSKEEQAAALERAGFIMERIDRGVEVLAARHEGVVLIQSQAVVSEAGLTDYTDELRQIIDPTFAAPSGDGR